MDDNNSKTPIAAEHWRQIVDAASDTAIISTDIHGRVTSWNKGAARLLGWTEHDMLGQTMESLFPEDGQVRLAQEMRDAMQFGRGGAEGWRVRKDHSQIWAIGEMTPIRDAGGKLVGYTKILRDRTAQRQAEEAVHEQRRVLEVLNRVGSALAQETNLRALVQLVTDAGVELTHAEFGAFFYNVTDDDGKRYMLYALSGASTEDFSRFPMPRKTEVFGPTFEGRAIVRSDDITKDPRYGRNAPFRGMPEGHLPVRSYLAVPVIARNGEVLGGLFFGHAAPGVFNERSERGLAALAAETAVAIDNTRLSESREREILERTRAQDALRDLNADLERQVSERTDELRKKDEALRQAQKMEAVGQLTGGVAHDFNNLIQIIISNIELVQRKYPTPSGNVTRALSYAMSGAQRAASLTQRLLAFSRRQALNPRAVDVNLLVGSVSELINRTLGETISMETVRGVGVWSVEVDANELEAAILNLAVNARDAMPDGGRLTIETANAHIDSAYAAAHLEVNPGQYVVISISDTGEGMDAETAARAFEPFFTTKPVGRGTGLGLSQVYGFVKQSGGHVKIYSESGEGTTVKIYLPRLMRNTDVSEPEDGPIPEGDQRETILVVEDDESVRICSVEALSELGYSVLNVADGPAAMRIIEGGQKIDLLFTDVVLPRGMTGAALAAAARALRPDIKVLFTTGYARNAIIHHGRLDKGVQLITKPFTFAQLADKVRNALDGIAMD